MRKPTWSDYSVPMSGHSVYRWRPCHRCGADIEDDETDGHLAGCQLSYRIAPTTASPYEHFWRDLRYHTRMTL